MANILWIAETPEYKGAYRDLINQLGHSVTIIRDGKEGIEKLVHDKPDLLITGMEISYGDKRFDPYNYHGLEVLLNAKHLSHKTPILIASVVEPDNLEPELIAKYKDIPYLVLEGAVEPFMRTVKRLLKE